MPQLGDRLAEIRLQRSWSAVVGPDLARRTRPGTLAEGCLTVVVDNSPWLHELSLRQSELLARIQRRHSSVRTLRLAVGTVALDPATAAPEPPSPTALTEHDRREIDAATADIADPALAATARRLLTRARHAAGAASGPRR